LADQLGGNLVGAVSWSFEFENQPWFYGFRDLATNGVDKPVLNVFRMFGMMKGMRIETESNRKYSLQHIIDSGIRKQTDIGALATKEKRSSAIMVWNYHDEDKQSPAETVDIIITHIPAKKVTVTEFRIDKEHSNTYELWKKMGMPQNPDKQQIAELEKTGLLQTNGISQKINVRSGEAGIQISLPRQAVSLLKLDW
jgi:xylan 1,4-beta-xylosidase